MFIGMISKAQSIDTIKGFDFKASTDTFNVCYQLTDTSKVAYLTSVNSEITALVNQLKVSLQSTFPNETFISGSYQNKSWSFIEDVSDVAKERIWIKTNKGDYDCRFVAGYREHTFTQEQNYIIYQISEKLKQIIKNEN